MVPYDILVLIAMYRYGRIVVSQLKELRNGNTSVSVVPIITRLNENSKDDIWSPRTITVNSSKTTDKADITH